jgi:hypothetical protein
MQNLNVKNNNMTWLQKTDYWGHRNQWVGGEGK